MRLKSVILLALLIGLSGCVGGQLEISATPGFFLSQPIHTIKVLNGTRYTLKLNYGKTIMIRPGGQVSIPYTKGDKSRKVYLSVVGIKGGNPIGTDDETMTIPSYRRSSGNSEDGWRVTRLNPMQ